MLPIRFNRELRKIDVREGKALLRIFGVGTIEWEEQKRLLPVITWFIWFHVTGMMWIYLGFDWSLFRSAF